MVCPLRHCFPPLCISTIDRCVWNFQGEDKCSPDFDCGKIVLMHKGGKQCLKGQTMAKLATEEVAAESDRAAALLGRGGGEPAQARAQVQRARSKMYGAEVQLLRAQERSRFAIPLADEATERLEKATSAFERAEAERSGEAAHKAADAAVRDVKAAKEH